MRNTLKIDEELFHLIIEVANGNTGSTLVLVNKNPSVHQEDAIELHLTLDKIVQSPEQKASRDYVRGEAVEEPVEERCEYCLEVLQDGVCPNKPAYSD